MFGTLPEDLREGWKVETEALSYADTAQKQLIRLSLLRLHEPKLIDLRKKVQTSSSMEEVIKLLQKSDLQDVNEDDLAELFFALGPITLTGLIDYQLKLCKKDTDVDGIAALTLIRHSILHALTSAART